LVSKAIVQAVEQQGSRFLELDKQSGMWTRATYRRAIDKTSQGLREQDREEDTGRQTFNFGDLTEGAGPQGRLGGRCNTNEQVHRTAPIHTPHLNDTETPPLMYFASSPHGTHGITIVGATGAEASTIPPESAVQPPRTYSSHIMSLSLKLESMTKEMQTWTQLLNCTEGAAQLECIQKVSSLSQEIREERLKFSS
jgi:hypothetical protein